jgi:hypothetical protein
MSVPYDRVPVLPVAGSIKGGRFGRGASILIWVVAGCQVVVAVSEWLRFALFRDDPDDVDLSSIGPLDVVAFTLIVAAAVVFVSWLRQVRLTAESLCRAEHRHGRAWVIAGWIVPVVWFWIPKQIVDDIVVASSPQTPPDAEVLPMEGSRIVSLWWAAWVGSNLHDLGYPLFQPDPMTAAGLAGSAALTTVSTMFLVVAALYAGRVIRFVNELQASRTVSR